MAPQIPFAVSFSSKDLLRTTLKMQFDKSIHYYYLMVDHPTPLKCI